MIRRGDTVTFLPSCPVDDTPMSYSQYIGQGMSDYTCPECGHVWVFDSELLNRHGMPGLHLSAEEIALVAPDLYEELRAL